LLLDKDLATYRIYDESSKYIQMDNISQLPLELLCSLNMVVNFVTVHLTTESTYEMFANYHCNTK